MFGNRAVFDFEIMPNAAERLSRGAPRFYCDKSEVLNGLPDVHHERIR
jgi:hypothetical protein